MRTNQNADDLRKALLIKKIDFKTEVKLPELGRSRFDFYIVKENLFIEVNGRGFLHSSEGRVAMDMKKDEAIRASGARLVVWNGG